VIPIRTDKTIFLLALMLKMASVFEQLSTEGLEDVNFRV
jgi:hypothetical protein